MNIEKEIELVNEIIANAMNHGADDRSYEQNGKEQWDKLCERYPYA